MDQSSALSKSLLKRVNEYIDQNEHRIVQDLQRILQFNTVSGGPTDHEHQLWRDEIRNGFEWLEELASDADLDYRNLEDTVCVLEQPGLSDEVLGVLLHLDVVPPGEGWTHPPFGGEIHDNIVFGRGCQDDKGPVVQMYHALAAIKTLNVPFRRTVRLIVGSEEETGVWADVKRYLELEKAPDFSIVPDGSFPIVNGEKGMIDMRMWSEIEGAEEGAIRLTSVISGVRSNVVPPLAEVMLECEESACEWIQDALQKYLQSNSGSRADVTRVDKGAQLRFFGKNAHGSMPWEGRNAARDALRFLAELPLQGPRANFARLLAQLVADDEGRALRIDNHHEFIKHTTQSLGVLRIDDNTCEAVLNIRHTPPQTVALILERVGHAARETADTLPVPQVEVINRSHEPLFVDPQRYPEYFDALETAYQTVTGREPRHVHTGGTTFAKAFPNAMCFGPTDAVEESELAHQADERIAVAHHLRNVRIYALSLALLALDLTGWDG